MIVMGSSASIRSPLWVCSASTAGPTGRSAGRSKDSSTVDSDPCGVGRPSRTSSPSGEGVTTTVTSDAARLVPPVSSHVSQTASTWSWTTPPGCRDDSWSSIVGIAQDAAGVPLHPTAPSAMPTAMTTDIGPRVRLCPMRVSEAPRVAAYGTSWTNVTGSLPRCQRRRVRASAATAASPPMTAVIHTTAVMVPLSTTSCSEPTCPVADRRGRRAGRHGFGAPPSIPYGADVKTILIPAVALAALTLAGCASPTAADRSGTDPSSGTSLTSCGMPLTVAAPPERAVTLEQGATEVMLALGLQDRMVGTSYLTDAVAPEWRKAYDDVPVLADQYPTTEQLREADPDFVYSMRASAFASEAAGSRQELVDLGVPAYLSTNDCEDPALVPDEVGFDAILDEVTDIARVFGVDQRGRDLVAEQRDTLEQVTAAASDTGKPSVAWLYSSVNGAPVVAGGNGLADTMGRVAGATNAFEDLDAQWGETSWDEIAQRDPDVIVVADLSRGLSGDSADDKIAQLRSDAVTKGLSAVRGDHLVAVPATELDPSVRSIDALQTVSTALTAYAEER
ncbi:hypothetical protein DEJ16_12570 [Curtobacterium sp. MCJR17_055]|nr:hypothetical protein DEJ16_12570 [Curtobacterium sp. MCJR17_055]